MYLQINGEIKNNKNLNIDNFIINEENNVLDAGDSFLTKITFGLIDRAEPPAFDTRYLYDRATRDAESLSDGKESQESRSVWSWLTFGLMD